MAQTNNKQKDFEDGIIIEETGEKIERDENSPFNKNVISRGESGSIGGADGKGVEIEEPELIIDEMENKKDNQKEDSVNDENENKESREYQDVTDFEDDNESNSDNSENKKDDKTDTFTEEDDDEAGMTDEEIDVYANMIADKYFEGTRNLTISWSQFSDLFVAEMVTRGKINPDIQFANTGKTIGEVITDVNKNIEYEIRKTENTKPALVSILKAVAKKYSIKMSIGLRLVMFLSMDMLQMGTIIFTLKAQNKKLMKSFVLETTTDKKRKDDLVEKIKKEQEINAEIIKNRKKNKNKENKKNNDIDLDDDFTIENDEETIGDIDESIVLQETINENS